MSPEDLAARNRELENRLAEAEETLRALRNGEVDAVVASGPGGDQVYTLKGADEAYRVMVEGMAEGALTLTPDGLILFANEPFAALVRSPLERVIGARFQDFVAPQDADTVSALLAGGDGRKAEVQLKTPAAAVAPVYLAARELVLDGVECLCLIVTDLSEQKRNSETVAVMQAVPAAVLIAHDAECRTMTGNHVAYQLLRMPFGTNVLRPAPDGGPPTHFRALKNGEAVLLSNLPTQLAARTGQAVHDYEFDLVFDDGASVSLFGNAVPLFDEAGRSRGAVGAFIDITERKRSEERLRQAQKLESIGLLAGGIAHDFNNLLVGVIGNASLAREMLPPEDRTMEFLDGIVRTGEQLANLTRQMLAYSGQGRFFLEHLDLSELIPEMSALVQPSIPKKIAISYELDRDLPPLEADRGQIQQIFMNLLLNAAEAIGSNAGMISIKTGVQPVDQAYIRSIPEAAELSPGDYVYLEVRDTGCGMDPVTRTKIFDPFFTTKFTGRGLGLAAVSGILRGHKGAILVSSAPGKGSCFTALLPVALGDVARPRPADRLAEPRGTGTVLVVDDEEVIRKVAGKALRIHGFDVLSAGSGQEAIEILKNHPGAIALVLLDLGMPGMSGDEVLPQLRKIRPAIKVVVSSGYNEAEALAMFQGQRVSAFIQKPYTSSQLAQKVKSALS